MCIWLKLTANNLASKLFVLFQLSSGFSRGGCSTTVTRRTQIVTWSIHPRERRPTWLPSSPSAPTTITWAWTHRAWVIDTWNTSSVGLQPGTTLDKLQVEIVVKTHVRTVNISSCCIRTMCPLFSRGFREIWNQPGSVAVACSGCVCNCVGLYWFGSCN